MNYPWDNKVPKDNGQPVIFRCNTKTLKLVLNQKETIELTCKQNAGRFITKNSKK